MFFGDFLALSLANVRLDLVFHRKFTGENGEALKNRPFLSKTYFTIMPSYSWIHLNRIKIGKNVILIAVFQCSHLLLCFFFFCLLVFFLLTYSPSSVCNDHNPATFNSSVIVLKSVHSFAK